MNKKEVLKKIKKNEYVLKAFETYKKTCNNYGIKEKDFNSYCEELISLFENDINYKCFICNDDILNDYEYQSLIEMKKEDITEESTTQLKDILKKDYYELFNLEYHEQYLFIEEDLTENLSISKKDYENYFKVSGYHDSELYFVFNQENIKYYDEDNINDNIDNLTNIDLDYFNIYLIISNNENRFNHKSEKTTDLNKSFEELRDLTKIELFNRLKESQKKIKDNKKQLEEIKKFKEDKEEINKIDLKKHSILNNCVFGFEENLLKDITQQEEEIKRILED